MLIASYFFARGAGGRSELSRFITTLAFQITISVPEVKQFVENAFRADPSIVHQSIANQLHRLVFEPLLAVSSVNSPPRTHVIVIDALDECNDRVAVQDFLNALASACSGPWLPLRWLFTSREHIQETYSSNAIRVMTTSFALEDFDAHSDIHKFLIYRFSDIIKNKARLFRGVPMPWPPTRDLAALVRKSGGLFIFAATLVHFVTDGKAAPDKKLQTVLALHTGLYPLYEQVLRDVPEIECFRRVLTTLMLIKEQPSISTLAELLELDNQDVLHALMAIQTIIHIPADDESPVQLNHTSLRDFLIDENRSKDLFIDPAVAHCTLAVDCVKLMNRTLRQDEFPTDAAPKYAALHWLDHLVDGHGSTDLLPTMLNILTDFSLSLTCDAWINTTLLNRIVGKTRNNLNSLCRVYEVNLPLCSQLHTNISTAINRRRHHGTSFDKNPDSFKGIILVLAYNAYC